MVNFRRPFVQSLLLLALAGCGEVGGDESGLGTGLGTGDAAGEGVAAVSTAGLEFAPTEIGRATIRQFAIENQGDGDLSIENIEIVNSSPMITFSSTFLRMLATEVDWRQATGAQTWDQHPAFALRPSGEIQVDIQFQPTSTNLECPNSSGTECGEIVITTNDRTTPVVRLPIQLDQS